MHYIRKVKHSIYLYLTLSLFVISLSHSLPSLFYLYLYSGSLCMTTRLYVGFIQRVVTVDTHCWMWVLHVCIRKAGTMYYVFLLSDQYFLSLFISLALLCFLLSHEVDPDWACHVRLLCMWECLLSVGNITCALHTCAFEDSYGGLSCQMRLTVCLWLYINCMFVYECLHLYVYVIISDHEQ